MIVVFIAKSYFFSFFYYEYLGFDVVELEVAPLNLQDHLLAPHTALGVQFLESFHTVIQAPYLVAIQFTREQVLVRDIRTA